jgi:hypothetical protein
MSQKFERRAMSVKELRVNESEGNLPVIEGYASLFDSWSDELGGCSPFREKVVKGAFTETIEKDDIRALYNHDPNYVLGRNTAGTLELAEDEKGLKVLIKPPKTQWAKDLVVSVKRGDISQMSFGFACELDKWSHEGAVDIRELVKVKLYDVSLVTYPAYPQTEVDVRSIHQEHQSQVAEEQAKAAKEKAEKTARLEELKKSFE